LLMMLRDEKQPMPGAVVLIAPWTDLTVSSPSYTSNAGVDPVINVELLREAGKLYAGKSDPADPMISPIFANLSGLPAMLIHVGEHERMLDDSVLFSNRAVAAGCNVTLQVWPQMWHVFHQSCPEVPEACDAILALADYIKLRLT
jgi:monoterpene epsilon-lactone hydrolase